jgi:hypothetical protein
MSAARELGVAPSPWNARQRMLLGLLLAIGVIGLIAGYAGTSGTLRVSRQVVWVNVAGAALLVSGAGVVLFLTAGRRSIGRRRVGLFGNVDEPDTAKVALSSTVATGDLVAAPTMTRYHRADCSFVADKEGVMTATAEAHQQAGRRPCGVCHSGGDA